MWALMHGVWDIDVVLGLVFDPVDKRERGDKNTTCSSGNDVVFLHAKVSYFCIIGVDVERRTHDDHCRPC